MSCFCYVGNCGCKVCLITGWVEMWVIVVLESCAAVHVISAGAAILIGVSGAYSVWIVLGQAYLCRRVTCLFETVAALCQPPLVQGHWGWFGLSGRHVYVCTLWWDQGLVAVLVLMPRLR